MIILAIKFKMPQMDFENKVVQFIEKVKEVREKDYGDFKRKVSQYLNFLEEQLEAPRLQSDFKEIRRCILYQALDDVELGREYVIDWAENLR